MVNRTVRRGCVPWDRHPAYLESKLTGKTSGPRQFRSAALAALLGCAVVMAGAGTALAAGGSLTLSVTDEQTGSPTLTRMELYRGQLGGDLVRPRRTVPAGVGVVLDRSLELTLPDGRYAFRLLRGPEYRVFSGNFALERSSLDKHSVALPRMVHMLEKGWTSGDCFVPPSRHSLPLRMAAEDLHLATVPERVEANPVAGRDPGDPMPNDPAWIVDGASAQGGLVFYRAVGQDPMPGEPPEALPVERLAAVSRGELDARVGVENPFAWALPVWLASRELDGVFVLGDWLRLDRKVMKVPEGRGPEKPGFADEQSVGRWAEQIYWHLLEAGFRLPPLAGSGTQGAEIPVGYNRLYVGTPLQEYERDAELEARPVSTPEAWWNAAWQGHSIATNGPLLRPTLGGKLPGHVFTARTGETLKLAVELTLSVRDPVDYLEVIHNNRVHYSARLDEFARSGGTIPPLRITESGWVLVRIVTLYEDHFRAAISAPWYIEVDQRRRISADSVAFFRRWLADYEQRLMRLPKEQLRRHVPYVRAAREFWAERAEAATTASAPGES